MFGWWYADDANTLITKACGKLEFSSKSSEVALKCSDLAVFEGGSVLESGDVALVDVGLLGESDLRDASGISDRAQRHVDASSCPEAPP